MAMLAAANNTPPIIQNIFGTFVMLLMG